MTLTQKEAPAAPPTPKRHGSRSAESNWYSSRVLQLIAALAVITAAFILLGWGDILLFIVMLVAIVMLHKAGHFVTAKRAGMKVTEYFVGFGRGSGPSAAARPSTASRPFPPAATCASPASPRPRR